MNVCFFEKNMTFLRMEIPLKDRYSFARGGGMQICFKSGMEDPAGFVNSDTAWKLIFIPPANEVQGLYRNHFVCPSVCADSCPAHNFFMV